MTEINLNRVRERQPERLGLVSTQNRFALEHARLHKDIF